LFHWKSPLLKPSFTYSIALTCEDKIIQYTEIFIAKIQQNVRKKKDNSTKTAKHNNAFYCNWALTQ
jgi:hypothetical protein